MTTISQWNAASILQDAHHYLLALVGDNNSAFDGDKAYDWTKISVRRNQLRLAAKHIATAGGTPCALRLHSHSDITETASALLVEVARIAAVLDVCPYQGLPIGHHDGYWPELEKAERKHTQLAALADRLSESALNSLEAAGTETDDTRHAWALAITARKWRSVARRQLDTVKARHHRA